MSEFLRGDRVRHKLGGPDMLVVSLVADLVNAVWWSASDTTFSERAFYRFELEHVTEKKTLMGTNEVELPKRVERSPTLWQYPYYSPQPRWKEDPLQWYAGRYNENWGIQHPHSTQSSAAKDVEDLMMSRAAWFANGNTQEPR